MNLAIAIFWMMFAVFMLAVHYRNYAEDRPLVLGLVFALGAIYFLFGDLREAVSDLSDRLKAIEELLRRPDKPAEPNPYAKH